jgi:predicted nucleic acid-binding protein
MAMRLILDTNRYTDMMRGDAEVTETVERAERTYLPVIVLGELRAGFMGGSRQGENERRLHAFLRKPPVRVLVPDEQTSVHYAALFHQLRLQGTPIPFNDLWIAALTLQHGLALYARDRHFDHLPQLMRI